MSSSTKRLCEALDLLGGDSRVAELFGIHRNAVWQWREKGIPADRVLTLVHAVDHQVSAKELRPDVFCLHHQNKQNYFHANRER